MTGKDNRSKIIKSIIICLLLFGIVLTYGLYVKYYNADSIEYDGHDYMITDEITSEEEITKIKKKCPYTHKRNNGYKIYARKNRTATREIYVEKYNGKFYNVSLKGSL